MENDVIFATKLGIFLVSLALIISMILLSPVTFKIFEKEENEEDFGLVEENTNVREDKIDKERFKKWFDFFKREEYIIPGNRKRR